MFIFPPQAVEASGRVFQAKLFSKINNISPSWKTWKSFENDFSIIENLINRQFTTVNSSALKGKLLKCKIYSEPEVDECFSHQVNNYGKVHFTDLKYYSGTVIIRGRVLSQYLCKKGQLNNDLFSICLAKRNQNYEKSPSKISNVSAVLDSLAYSLN
jgi:hypothetical protein